MDRTLTVQIEGTNATIMHNGRGANPRDPIAVLIKAITKKRQKQETDFDMIEKLEWAQGLYTTAPLTVTVDGEDVTLDCKGAICWPAPNLQAGIVAAAKNLKQGASVKKGLLVTTDMILNHNGPKDFNALAADPSFRDVRSVKVQRATVMRCRPIFPEWTGKFSLHYSSQVFDRAQLEQILGLMGEMVGLSDYRPYFGRFIVKAVSE